MSSDNKRKYPLQITEIKINKNTLRFTVKNYTNNTCNIFINDDHINSSNDKIINIRQDISNYYMGKIHIKAETSDKFVLKTIHRDLSNYFRGLKKTLIGEDNTYFLVNDKNNEIRQHYDSNYECHLDIERFKNSTLSKKSFLDKKGINYGLFVVPDKSITLRDKLPFKTNEAYRHTDLLEDVVYDLNPIILPEDRYVNDTHISSKSSIKIVSYMASIINNCSYDDVYHELTGKVHFERSRHLGDLFNFQNWSYERDELFHENKYIEVDIVRLNHPAKKVSLYNIPEEFRHISRRESFLYYNRNSITDKRAVVLHDSTTLLLIDALTCYYREVFFYWDHWFFNDELIDWFNPDDVLEIRTERFLDNPQYQMVDENYVVKFPISAELKEFRIDDYQLTAKILIKDYRQLPVHTCIKTFIDEKLICEEESDNLYYEFSLDLNDYCNGEYVLRFEIKSKYKYREVIREFTLEDSLEPLFKDLKMTYKGIGDSFFVVNDKSNELRQHYDKMYVSNFNIKRFIPSLTSKKKYLEKLGVRYNLFIIPDKSVVLNDYIPFDDMPHRHVDSLNEYLVDLIEIVEEDDYLINDTNVSMCAGLKIVSYILSYIYEDKSQDDYMDDLLKGLTITDSEHRGNLFTNKAWSYPDDMELRDKYYAVKTNILSPSEGFVEYDLDNVPLEFRQFSSTKSQYLHNDHSLTDKKVLVLCDDSIKPLIPSLLSYYKDVFLYYDLWFFNKDLVEWFSPCDVLEIRGERTLENTQYQLVSIEDNFVIPITRKVEKCDLDDGVLKVKIHYTDLRHVPVESSCKLLLDNKVIHKSDINGVYDAEIKVGNGRYVVEVVLEASKITKSNVFKKVVGESIFF